MSMWHMQPSTWEPKRRKKTPRPSKLMEWRKCAADGNGHNVTAFRGFIEKKLNQIEIERCSESGIYRHATKMKNMDSVKTKARQPGSLVHSADTRGNKTRKALPRQ